MMGSLGKIEYFIIKNFLVNLKTLKYLGITAFSKYYGLCFFELYDHFGNFFERKAH